MGRSTPVISWTPGRAPASSIGTASGRGRRSSTPECSWPLCPGFGCCTPRTPARRCGRSRRFWRGRATCWTSARWHGIERPRCCSSRSVCRPPGAAIRALGLAAAIPALGLDDRPVELTLRGYTPGLRATLEVRAGDRHFALKLYAEDPQPEAELYEALAAVGLVGEGPVRVPPLLARDRSLQVLAIGWLEGPTGQELLKGRRGERAGELAACWLRCAAALPVKVGLPLGAAHMVYNAGKEVVQLDAADRGLGSAAKRLARILTQTLPKNGSRRLVHGTFYARHILDQGDGVGVIDWERFGRGPLELDAGMFLATTWRYGLDHARLAAEAARAEEALLAGTPGLLDERVLTWHRAAG